MVGYFGVYNLAKNLDGTLQGKDINTTNWIIPIAAVNVAFVI